MCVFMVVLGDTRQLRLGQEGSVSKPTFTDPKLAGPEKFLKITTISALSIVLCLFSTGTNPRSHHNKLQEDCVGQAGQINVR